MASNHRDRTKQAGPTPSWGARNGTPVSDRLWVCLLGQRVHSPLTLLIEAALRHGLNRWHTGAPLLPFARDRSAGLWPALTTPGHWGARMMRSPPPSHRPLSSVFLAFTIGRSSDRPSYRSVYGRGWSKKHLRAKSCRANSCCRGHWQLLPKHWHRLPI